MERLEFEARVRRATQQAKAHPAAYQRRMHWWVTVGDAIPLLCAGFFVLILVACATAALIHPSSALLALVIGSASGITAWRILRGRWHYPDLDLGTFVDEKEAPLLHELVQCVASDLGVPAPDNIYITADLNAFAHLAPKRRLIGAGHRSTVGIGLPLMHSMRVNELAGIIAHEMGHLAGQDGLLLNRAIPMRLSWQALLQRQRESGSTTLTLAARFGRWYLPRLEANMLALERAQELEADRCSRKIVGAETAGSAFLRLYGISFAVQQPNGWGRVSMAPLTCEEPPRDIFLQTLEFATRPIPAWDIQRGLAMKWFTLDSPYDCHPAPSERLRNCGVELRFESGSETSSIKSIAEELSLPLGEESSARKLLGESLEDVTSTLCTKWVDQAEPQWNAARDAALQEEELYYSLASQDIASAEQRVEQAVIAGSLWGPEAAETALSAALTSNPDHAFANFAWGSNLLRRNERDGLALLERALDLDPDLAPDISLRITTFYALSGDVEAAEEWHDRHRNATEESGLAYDEQTTKVGDSFRPIDNAELRGAVALDCAKHANVRAAHLVLKDKQYDQTPSYVIAIQPPRGIRSHGNLPRIAQVLMTDISESFEVILQSNYQLHVVWNSRELPWQSREERRLARQILQINESCVYHRNASKIAA